MTGLRGYASQTDTLAVELTSYIATVRQAGLFSLFLGPCLQQKEESREEAQDDGKKGKSIETGILPGVPQNHFPCLVRSSNYCFCFEWVMARRDAAPLRAAARFKAAPSPIQNKNNNHLISPGMESDLVLILLLAKYWVFEICSLPGVRRLASSTTTRVVVVVVD